MSTTYIVKHIVRRRLNYFVPRMRLDAPVVPIVNNRHSEYNILEFYSNTPMCTPSCTVQNNTLRAKAASVFLVENGGRNTSKKNLER